jgi:hypothetical protein
MGNARMDDLLAGEKEHEIGSNGKKWEEELAGCRYDERGEEESCDKGFQKRTGCLHHGEGEDTHESKQKVLSVVVRPSVRTQRLNRVVW